MFMFKSDLFIAIIIKSFENFSLFQLFKIFFFVVASALMKKKINKVSLIESESFIYTLITINKGK